jgi:hypothetical protein
MENRQVAEVVLSRPYSDEDRADAGRWNVSLDEDETVQTSEPIELVRAHFRVFSGHVRCSFVLQSIATHFVARRERM